MSPCNKLDAWNNDLNLFYLFIFYNVWITKNQFKHKFKCKICGKPNRFAEVDVEGLKILSSYTQKKNLGPVTFIDQIKLIYKFTLDVWVINRP